MKSNFRIIKNGTVILQGSHREVKDAWERAETGAKLQEWRVNHEWVLVDVKL